MDLGFQVVDKTAPRSRVFEHSHSRDQLERSRGCAPALDQRGFNMKEGFADLCGHDLTFGWSFGMLVYHPTVCQESIASRAKTR